MSSSSAAHPNRLPARCRLRDSAAFTRLLKQGVRGSDGLISLWVLRNGLEYSRFGLIVGRKHGNAVCRNRVRRILREAFRLGRLRMPAGFDFAASPHVGASIALQPAIESLLRLSERLARRLEAP